MLYTAEEVMEYVEQEDVRFIRLAFFDAFGHPKNISIIPSRLRRAFSKGLSFDASAAGVPGCTAWDSLLLFPLPETMAPLPRCISADKAVRLYCSMCRPGGAPVRQDGRYILRRAVQAARDMGFSISFGVEYAFYLFDADANGNPRKTPHDGAGYLDTASGNKGEDLLDEICGVLGEMGIVPSRFQHQHGPGQHLIGFCPGNALQAADHAMTVQAVARAVAGCRGLHVSFAPRPLPRSSVSGLHVQISMGRAGGKYLKSFLAGILDHLREMTAFLNPTRQSYERLGALREANRAPLVSMVGREAVPHIELCAPDPAANPYIAFALLLHAGLDGIRRGLAYGGEDGYKNLPGTPEEAFRFTDISKFIADILPEQIVDAYARSVL